MLQVIEKAVKKVAEEWAEQEFKKIFLEKNKDRWGYDVNINKLEELIRRITENETRKILLSALEKENIPITDIVKEFLQKNTDKIKITIHI